MKQSYYESHKEEIKRRYREYYRTHQTEERNRRKNYYRRHRLEEIKASTTYIQAHKSSIAQASFVLHQALKTEVLTYYGNGGCACVSCGYKDIRALSIDHIDGGGYRHRKSAQVRNIYRWLKAHHYPEGYQTLCMNCQWIKRAERQEYENKNQTALNAIPRLL